jgi:F-type H+-transporting ATPase subunit alpha
MIKELPEQIAGLLDTVLANESPQFQTEEIGTVSAVTHGVAYVQGLTDVKSDELIRLPHHLAGLATSINRHEVGLILLGDSSHLRPGDNARRTRRGITTIAGNDLLGRVVDPLGNPLDGGAPIRKAEDRSIEQRAPDIIDRAPVTQPLQTGVKAIDATIPIGRGQRELILGDRQTGKTAIAVSALCNQKHTGVIGIYCTIGQRDTATAYVIETLRKAGVLQNTIVVATSGDDAPGLQYIAPYAATAMAEYFMHQGRDVLIVYDDLTRHARAYRELSLLLRRPPGREAYPGDIFYVHARLLERATHLRSGGSLTALPIIETQAGNISAYIPTNLISITDGQIYLSPALFQKGILPAIDIGRSVSRVGGKAQHPAYRTVVQALKLAYAQFEELESFARFSTRLDEETRRNIERGRRVREILKQGEHELLSVAEQIAVLLAVTEGLMDEIPVNKLLHAEQAIRAAVLHDTSGPWQHLDAGKIFSQSDREAALSLIRQALAQRGQW